MAPERSMDPQTPLDNFKRKTKNKTCSLDLEETGDSQLTLLALGSICPGLWNSLGGWEASGFGITAFLLHCLWTFFSISVFHLIRCGHSKICNSMAIKKRY